MDVPSSNVSVFGAGLSRWDPEKTGSLDSQDSKVFDEAIDEIGLLSSKAQEQTTPLTTAAKIRERADTVYVMCDGTGKTLQGFLRLGRKYLFLYPGDGGEIVEQDTICLLDFYVHESLQRQGIGFDLFKAALKEEGLTPTGIAYDKPSPKLKPFLSKHFGLHNCLDQPNRFMVFKEHFGGIATRLQDQAV
eukprot:g7511.t1